MAIASVHLSLLMLTAQQNQLNYRLSVISNERQRITAYQSEIIRKASLQNTTSSTAISNAVTDAISKLTSSATNETLSQTDLTVMLADFQKVISSNTTTNFAEDPNYILLQLQDNDLDMQQGQLETQLKAVSANLEAQQKLEDNNIKKDFGYTLSL